MCGTHRGDWLGHPATGRWVAAEEMMSFRFDGDLLVERWEGFDEHGLAYRLRPT